MKYLMAVMDTSRYTELSTKDNKDPIMVMIQKKERKKYVKKVYSTTEYHQDIWDNMGTALSGTT